MGEIEITGRRQVAGSLGVNKCQKVTTKVEGGNEPGWKAVQLIISVLLLETFQYIPSSKHAALIQASCVKRGLYRSSFSSWTGLVFLASSADMQRPTCTNVRIRSTQDAHKIFFAIQQGLLHMVTRRLDAEERQALTTGCVYAWEERGPHTEITGLGIERFTEGRRWSPSRVRDEFLFYYEKYSPIADANNSSVSLEKQPPRDWDPLVKQTYSVWVETEKGRRKWHLTAYFTQTTVDDLGTIDDILGVQELAPPPGLFKSTRVGKGRGKTDEPSAQTSDTLSKPPTTVTRTYAPFPTLHNRYPSQSESPPASESVMMYEPYENTTYAGYTNSDTRTPSPAISVNTTLLLLLQLTPRKPRPFIQYSHPILKFKGGEVPQLLTHRPTLLLMDNLHITNRPQYTQPYHMHNVLNPQRIRPIRLYNQYILMALLVSIRRRASLRLIPTGYKLQHRHILIPTPLLNIHPQNIKRLFRLFTLPFRIMPTSFRRPLYQYMVFSS
ncbi:Gti1/Pac2 family-domain-containing protein [Collybia nuda]|uniref:Gti1/Pac2 family-domain-containing protein n=1 Tax=Collybia nuda TaxID=64659 RepID=A0A9P6CE15_9AGAR|nr:Gti1/Pac2 family-domain-containing protein [Collybia nuda]